MYSRLTNSVGSKSLSKNKTSCKLSSVRQCSSSDSFKTSGSTDCKLGCVLSCSNSCSYCTFCRASAKERIKSRSVIEKNKACQRYFLCKSMSFCPSCSQCPQCCHRTECRGKVTKVSAYLARDGCKSSGGIHSEGGLCSTFPNEAPSNKVKPDPERLCKPGKEPVPQRGIACSAEQVVSGKSGCQVIPCILQPVIPSSKTQQKMETNLGPQSTKSVSQSWYLQNGNTRNNPVTPAKGGMGNFVGFQRHLFPHSHQENT